MIMNQFFQLSVCSPGIFLFICVCEYSLWLYLIKNGLVCCECKWNMMVGKLILVTVVISSVATQRCNMLMGGRNM